MPTRIEKSTISTPILKTDSSMRPAAKPTAAMTRAVSSRGMSPNPMRSTPRRLKFAQNAGVVVPKSLNMLEKKAADRPNIRNCGSAKRRISNSMPVTTKSIGTKNALSGWSCC